MAKVENLLLRPVEINPIVDQASDTDYWFELLDACGKPLDLSSFTAVMQLRPYPGAKKIYDELTTENGRLKIVGNAVAISFPSEVTATYKFDAAFYDLVIISLGKLRYRVAEGVVRTTPWVTK